MSLKSKLLQGFTMAAAVVAFAGLTAAQETTAPKTGDTQKQEKPDGRGFGRHGGHGRGMEDGKFGRRGGAFGMLRGIELTDAQKAQVKTIFETNKPDEATMQQMRSFRDARKNGGTLTDDQKAQMKAFRQQFRQKQEGVRQQILAILTPEQQQQLEARKADMQKRREEFRQKREQWKQQNQQSDKPTDN